jgi:hypothetical protein
MSGVAPQTNRVGEICIGVEFNDEIWRPAFTPEARIHAVKKAFASRNAACALGCYGDGFLRTGAAGIAFPASAASDSASFVPSIASSSVSR